MSHSSSLLAYFRSKPTPPPADSSPADRRTTPLAPGGVALLGVFGQRQGHEAIEIDIRGVGDMGHVKPAVQRLFGQPGGERRKLGQAISDRRRPRDEVGMGYEPLGEAETERVIRCHRVAMATFIACPLPTHRARRTIPPWFGRMPKATCGRRHSARSEAMIRSQQ